MFEQMVGGVVVPVVLLVVELDLCLPELVANVVVFKLFQALLEE